MHGFRYMRNANAGRVQANVREAHAEQGVIQHMTCPCATSIGATSVLDSRKTKTAVRRRRECPKCGRRITTYEAEKPQIKYKVRRVTAKVPDRRASEFVEQIRLIIAERNGLMTLTKGAWASLLKIVE